MSCHQMTRSCWPGQGARMTYSREIASRTDRSVVSRRRRTPKTERTCRADDDHGLRRRPREGRGGVASRVGWGRVSTTTTTRRNGRPDNSAVRDGGVVVQGVAGCFRQKTKTSSSRVASCRLLRGRGRRAPLVRRHDEPRRPAARAPVAVVVASHHCATAKPIEWESCAWL